MIKTRIEYLGDRNVHQTLISNLKEKTRYVIGISYSNNIDNIVSIYKYKTFSQHGELGDKLRFIAGGDVSSSDTAWKMTMNLLQYKPELIILGGDISYDDGSTSCYHTYDAYFRMMQ